MTSFFSRIIPVEALINTIYRFPLAAVCSVCLFILLVLNIHDIIQITDSDNFYGRSMVLCAFGFFWFVLVRLFFEGNVFAALASRVRYLSWLTENSLGVIGFALLAGIIFSRTNISLFWMMALMLPALLLGLSVGPYLAKQDNFSFWFYNRQMWFGAAIAILAGVIWGGGLSAAIASINYLFEVKIASELYGDIWVLSMVVFAPLYALSWVPEKLRYTEQDCDTAPQLAFVLNWVLAPLVIFYTFILYAYFIKIAVGQSLPRGQLSYMVTGFGGLGVLTYLAGWPLRETGGVLLKLIHRYFFPVLLIPVLVQALAIYLRIDQYGLTEQRYIVALSALWFAVLGVLFTLKKPSLKLIPGLLALLFLAAAVGPVNAPKMAERSQVNRLEALLIKNNILVNGEIVKAPGVITFDDRKSISSILSFLQRRQQMRHIEQWLPNNDETISSSPRKLTKAMGFSYVWQHQLQTNQRINLQGRNHVAFDVSNVDIFIPQSYISCFGQHCSPQNPQRLKWQTESQKISAGYQEGILTILVEDKGELSFDVKAYAREEIARSKDDHPRDLTLQASQQHLTIKVIFQNLSIRHTSDRLDEGFKLESFSFETLISY